MLLFFSAAGVLPWVRQSCRWSELMGRRLHSRPSQVHAHTICFPGERERSWLVGKDQSANSSPRAALSSLCESYISFANLNNFKLSQQPQSLLTPANSIFRWALPAEHERERDDITRARQRERAPRPKLWILKNKIAPGNSPQIPLCFLERERVGGIPQLFYYFDSKFISAQHHAHASHDIHRIRLLYPSWT